MKALAARERLSFFFPTASRLLGRTAAAGPPIAQISLYPLLSVWDPAHQLPTFFSARVMTWLVAMMMANSTTVIAHA